MALLGLAGVGLTLASCSSTGFAGSIYMSPDNDGKRTQTDFFADIAETPGIYVIIPIVSGKNDETLNVSIHIRSLFDDPSPTFQKLIPVASVAPGVNTKPTKVSVQFPEPPPILTINPADPQNPTSTPQQRAIGRFQFVAEMNGDTQTVNFSVLPPATNPLPDPNAGTPNAEPIPGACSGEGTPPSIVRCPRPSENYAVICCSSTGVCGTGVLGTGLCY